MGSFIAAHLVILTEKTTMPAMLVLLKPQAKSVPQFLYSFSHNYFSFMGYEVHP